jgi:hypothetical protein
MTKMPLINLKMTKMSLFSLSHFEMTEMPLFILQNDKNAMVLAHFKRD